jgi:hypothetical protein
VPTCLEREKFPTCTKPTWPTLRSSLSLDLARTAARLTLETRFIKSLVARQGIFSAHCEPSVLHSTTVLASRVHSHEIPAVLAAHIPCPETKRTARVMHERSRTHREVSVSLLSYQHWSIACLSMYPMSKTLVSLCHSDGNCRTEICT